MIKSLTGLAAIFLLAAMISGCSNPQAGPAAPLKVKVVTPLVDSIVVKKDFVGQIFGASDVPIRARVDGFLEDEKFREGRLVRKGQVLYHIDPLPSEQQVSASNSSYEEARAGLVQAENDLERIRPLAEINAVSKSDLDAAIANKLAAEKRVEAARANLKLSQINLSYTEITSPITGVIGKSKVEIGEYVGSSFNAVQLNTVSRIDTVRVEFFLTEEDYLQFARAAAARRRETGADQQVGDNQTISLELILSDGTVFDQPGRVRFLDRGVDPTTGTILVQAEFPNPDRILRPGQFAKVRAVVNEIPEAVLIPLQCVMEIQGISNVKVVNDSNKVEVRTVQLGPVQRDQVVIAEGLKPGEKVIITGLQLARNGAAVSPETTEFQPQQSAQ